MKDRMTIGEVARRTGVSVKALRFYDQLGILAVEGRSDGNYRLFSDNVFECLAHIRALQAAGLTLSQVQELARAQREGRDPRVLLRGAYAEALERIDREIADREAKRDRLERLRRGDAGGLTLQCTGGCTVNGDNAATAVGGRRVLWPATSRAAASSGSGRNWRVAPVRARGSSAQLRSSGRSSNSSFGASR